MFFESITLAKVRMHVSFTSRWRFQAASAVFARLALYRAEKSHTPRHLCEYTGLDFEMEINESYFEVMDQVDQLLVRIFKSLDTDCDYHLKVVRKQHPFEPLQYLDKTLRLKFTEGIQLLNDAGIEADPLADLNTQTEKQLGRLVKEKYHTDCFILHRFPLAVRPFYTMPAAEDSRYSNSFDVFVRGIEVASGGQRIHQKKFLLQRAKECNINSDTGGLAGYFQSFSYGTPPHGGCGFGLERVGMTFCGLKDIRMMSLFPRDSSRLTP